MRVDWYGRWRFPYRFPRLTVRATLQREYVGFQRERSRGSSCVQPTGTATSSEYRADKRHSGRPSRISAGPERYRLLPPAESRHYYENACGGWLNNRDRQPISARFLFGRLTAECSTAGSAARRLSWIETRASACRFRRRQRGS